MKQLLSVFTFLGLTLSASAAPPVSSALSVLPAAPTAGETIEAQVLWGAPPGLCLRDFSNPQGLRAFVDQSDGTITLDLVAEFDPGFGCSLLSFPISYPIGELEPGSYELILSRVDRDVTFPASDTDRTFIESAEFIVGAASIMVNTLRWQAMAALALLIGLIGFTSLSRLSD